jgi:hypothetical protein|tara:strand:- start:759 stop:1145 length:387 start_codon:yes stop_codon:yes gene_type:complete
MNRGLEESFRNKLGDREFKVTETSYLGLKPGNLIQLTYEGSRRYGLVVSSRRTSDGMFLSSRNNTLINVVLVRSLSDAMFSLMVNNLYNNETACKYTSPTIIGVFLGRQNFRTFNVAKMRDIYKVVIV